MGSRAIPLPGSCSPLFFLNGLLLPQDLCTWQSLHTEVFSHLSSWLLSAPVSYFRSDALPDPYSRLCLLLHTPVTPFTFPSEWFPEFTELIKLPHLSLIWYNSKTTSYFSHHFFQSNVFGSSLSFHVTTGKFINFPVTFSYMTQFHYLIVTHFQILKRPI